MPRRPNTNPAVGAFLPPELDSPPETETPAPGRTLRSLRDSTNAQMSKSADTQKRDAANVQMGKSTDADQQPVRGKRVQAQLLPEIYELVTLETVRRNLHARDIFIEAAVELMLSDQVDEVTRTRFIERVHKRRPKRGVQK